LMPRFCRPLSPRRAMIAIPLLRAAVAVRPAPKRLTLPNKA